MELQKQQKAAILAAITDPRAAQAVIDMVESALTQAATVAAITSTNLVGVDGTGSNAAPLAGTETRLDAIETKINAVLTALKAAGLMAS